MCVCCGARSISSDALVRIPADESRPFHGRVTPPPEPLLDEQAPACGKWPEDFERESDALLADERVRRALSELVDNDEEIRAAIVRIMRTSTGTERFERVWDLIEGPLVVALDRLSIPELMNHKCVITEELLKLAADRVEATSETRRDERERRQNALWLRRGLGGPMYAVKWPLQRRADSPLADAVSEVLVRARPRERRARSCSGGSARSASRGDPPDDDPDDLAQPPRRARGLSWLAAPPGVPVDRGARRRATEKALT